MTLEKAVAARDQARYDVLIAVKDAKTARGTQSEAARLADLFRIYAEYEKADLAVVNEMIP